MKRCLESMPGVLDLKEPRPKMRLMRGQRWGTLTTMTAVEVSPAYQFKYERSPKPPVKL